MLELTLKGSKRYWAWIGGLLLIIGVGLFFYIQQLQTGLWITGLGRDNSWGLFTSQMNFLVGVAAGGVMLVLPYYLHNYKRFGKITILGEFLAVSALCMCLLFLLIHLGKPERMANVFLHPSPSAMVLWDATVIMSYLLINIVVGWVLLESERKSVPPPAWTKPLIYLSIPMAIGIHTITAFLYSGVAGRGFWLTAVLAPRFLASAFSSGPALLILLALLIGRLTKFKPEKEAIQTLAVIVTYALIANLFFLLCEVFTAFYSNIGEHKSHLLYLYVGLQGKGSWVPWMWTSLIFMAGAAALMVIPKIRRNPYTLMICCIAIFVGTWIDKGFGLMAGGFSPNPFHRVVEYTPTYQEVAITIGIYGIGILLLTLLYKVVISVKEEAL